MQPDAKRQLGDRHRRLYRERLRRQPTLFDWICNLLVAAVMFRLWIFDHVTTATRLAVEAGLGPILILVFVSVAAILMR